ncbi:MAG: hypothetical protein WBH68_00605 [Erysipelotrichaceae bacterium]|jgi:hypothetical protein|nr:hypothetical protein [Bacillota bacterium]NLP22553.1 hypothetical protein [Erysipelotrichaceae bacterium]HCY06911.1 hypothetical protein [Erysipelotrichaceae bacterium]
MKILNLYLDNAISASFESPIYSDTIFINKSFIIDSLLIDNNINYSTSLTDNYKIIKLPCSEGYLKMTYHG